ncbi:hypothetical protein C4565_00540 [Candidatus Parcubacteria bacterium]|nr:MAG: hypothetical protein C4565_00540 [Candidatus Parcubacteria bacterium]
MKISPVLEFFLLLYGAIDFVVWQLIMHLIGIDGLMSIIGLIVWSVCAITLARFLPESIEMLEVHLRSSFEDNS